jgi:hypothetical protein
MTESQPALGSDGRLLDASKIEWYNDPDDARPIQPTSNPQKGIVFKLFIFQYVKHLFAVESQHTRPVRTTQGTRLAEVIAAEKLDEFGNIDVVPTARPSRRRPKQPRQSESHPASKRKRIMEDVGTDADDDNFATSTEDDSDSGDTCYELFTFSLLTRDGCASFLTVPAC